MVNPFEIETKFSGKVKRGKNLGFDEAFLDLQNEEPEVLEDEREGLNYRFLVGVCLVLMAALGARIFFLQGANGAEYRSLAEGNKLRVQYVLAPRGLLLDRNGQIIAANTPSFELDVVTADLPTEPDVFNAALSEIAQIVEQDFTELSDRVAKMVPNSFQDQALVENITKEQALVLIGRANDWPGFKAENNAVRDYKDPLAFTHLTGYTGKINAAELKEVGGRDYALNDYIGKTGIEVEYEEYLHGIDGKKQSEIDAQGNFKKTLAEVPATPGDTVKLNIDYGLQKALYDSMVATLAKNPSKKAAAVATNPQTGEVLALVSLPGFDSNMFARGITQKEYSALLNDSNNPLLNRVVSGNYPPGSTIKPVMALAALSEKIVDPSTKILDDGAIHVGSYTFNGYERSGLGIMDIYSAIARSSDIYFYSIGGGNPKSVVKDGLGPEKIAEWFRKFHIGTPLGIDLPNEKSGLVPDPDWKRAVKKEAWYLGDTYHESIGQGDVLSTPLQVNSWTATIANGGKVMQPYILNQVEDKNGQVIKKGESKILSEGIFDPAFIKVVQDGMRQTVTDGSGRSLLNLGVDIAGKTGTAQFDARDLSRYHAWFTSYAPFDHPTIALTVLAEAAGEGHSVAVPISKSVYQWWVANRYKK